MCKNRYFSNADAKVATFSEPANISASFFARKIHFCPFRHPIPYIYKDRIVATRPRVSAADTGQGAGTGGGKPAHGPYRLPSPAGIRSVGISHFFITFVRTKPTTR